MRRIIKEQIDQEYTWVNTILENSDISFMNHGYYSKNRFSGTRGKFPNQESMYLYIASLANLDSSTRLLEVGSGRGGGLSLLSNFHNLQFSVGLDLNRRNIEYSTNMHTGPKFVLGDAENMPFDDESFNAVINIESVHCYPNLQSFMMESFRVLAPGGTLVIADSLFVGDDAARGDYSGNISRVPDYEDLFHIETYDITSEVMESCRQDAMNFSKLDYPEIVSHFISDIPQKMYEGYVSGSARYIVHVCKRNG